jgi:hypothetical protein
MDLDFTKMTPKQIDIAKSVVIDAEKYGVDPEHALITVYKMNNFSSGLPPRPGEKSDESSQIIWENQFMPPPAQVAPTERTVDPMDKTLAAGAGAAAGASLVGAGAAANAAKNFFSGTNRIIQSAENAGSMGAPLTDWQLASKEGQLAEMKRLEFRDLMNQYKASSGKEDVIRRALTTEQDAAQRALARARVNEQRALTEFVSLGGGKNPPASPATTAAAPTAAAPAAPIDPKLVAYKDLNIIEDATSMAREISQNESAHYRSLDRNYRMKIVDALAQKYGETKTYIEMMLNAGPHAPTKTGLVLLPQKDVNIVNTTQTPAQQITAAQTPGERAAAQAEASAAQARANQARIDDMALRQRFNEADRLLKEQTSARTGAATAERGTRGALIENQAMRGGTSEAIAPALSSVSADMAKARKAAMTAAYMRPIKAALPIAGGALAGLDIMDALDAYKKGDYKGVGTSAASGVGGLLTMFGPTAILGSILMGASGAAEESEKLRRELKNRKQDPESNRYLDALKALLTSKTSTPFMN